MQPKPDRWIMLSLRSKKPLRYSFGSAGTIQGFGDTDIDLKG